MKTVTLIILFAISGLMLSGQNTFRYNFNNTLGESNGNTPSLTPLGNTGTFLLDTLNEISGKTKTVYRFGVNNGLQFDNAAAGNFIDSTYSIELYFVFDELSSWKRVVDWKNRKTDHGAYVYNGKLNFYNYVYSGTAPVIAGEYTYYVITRDAATQQLLIYTDAKEEISFTDSYGDGIIDADHVLNFFYDDLVVANEASSGAVALINLYDYVLDTTTIKQNFSNLQSTVFSVGEKSGEEIRLVYPNPASGRVTIDLSSFPSGSDATLSFIPPTGTAATTIVLKTGHSHSLDISSLPLSKGVYLVRVETGGIIRTQKLVVY